MPHLDFKEEVIEELCVEERVRLAFTAHALPSWGESVVVSLSV